VRVTGCKGKPATDTYKVCATYMDGYRATAVSPIGGPRAAEKARRTAEAILARCRNIFKQLGLDDFSKVNLQTLGSDDAATRDAVLWLTVAHTNKKALEFFAREVAPAGTGMAPGITAIVGGRPRPSPVLKLYSFLYPKQSMTASVSVNDIHVGDYVADCVTPSEDSSRCSAPGVSSDQAPITGSQTYRLEELAFARSGDKGNNCNIGVIARDARFLPYLREQLTAAAVERYFSYLFEDNLPAEARVIRYDVPGINGFNFVLKNALGGGGVASLRSDPQGKAAAQRLLDFVIKDAPSDLISS